MENLDNLYCSIYLYRLDEIISNAAGLDMFIGDELLIGKGLGSKIIAAFLTEYIWPKFQYCLMDPDIKNVAAIRCYRKLSFREHAIIDTKDALSNPVKLQLLILKK